MVDPGSAFLVGKGLEAFGGLFDHSKANSLKEQRREFDVAQQIAQQQSRSQTQMDQTSAVGGLNRQMEQAPLRDKVLYMLNQRSGMVPQNFQPRDMMNPWSQGASNPQQGGIDPQALQQAMGRYQAPDFQRGVAGSGGIDPHVYQQMMQHLGMNGGQLGDIPLSNTGPYRTKDPAAPPQPGPQNIPNGGSPWGPGGGGGPGIGGTMPGAQQQAPPPMPGAASPQMEMIRRSQTRRY